MKSAMRTKSAHGLCSLNCNGSFVVGFFLGGGVVYFLRKDRVEDIVANEVLLIVTAAD